MAQVRNGDGEDALDLVWGTVLIARKIKRTPRQANHMLVTGALPGAKKIGGRWVISERALRSLFDDTAKLAA